MGVRAKIQVLGVTGAGKTGALACLANAGFRLWIVDLDDGTNILHNICRAKYPKLQISDHDNIEVGDINIMKVANSFSSLNGTQPKREKDGWERFQKVLASWKYPRKPGDKYWFHTLTNRDIFVLDTISGLVDVLQDYALNINSLAAPEQRTYNSMQADLDFYLRILCASSARCHIIANAHLVAYQDGGVSEFTKDKMGRPQKIQTGGKEVYYPRSVGPAMSKSMGRHFNDTIILSAKDGLVNGKPGRAHVISTKEDGIITTKTSNPFGTKPEYNIENGLAEYFRDIGVTLEEEEKK